MVDQSVSSIYSYDATASDNEGIDSWTWTKVSGTGDITFGSANAEDTTISSNTDGTFVIRLTVTDNAGNQVSDEMNFTWDETAPTVSVATQTVCDVTPDFSGNVNDNSATINVNVNGSDYAGTNNGDGTWSLAGTVLAAADTGIPSGTYNVTVTATDTFTNAATDTTSNELVINCSQFITTWTTSGASESVTLPLINGGTHEFVVDWGDSSASSYINAWDDTGKSYTYASAGTYTVTISGNMGGWSFDANQNGSLDDGSDETKLSSVTNWGTFSFADSINHFYGASNLTITATDIPDMTGVTSLEGPFGVAPP